jgi:hypothetical protein
VTNLIFNVPGVKLKSRPANVNFYDLGGGVHSISSNQKTQTKVDLKGKVFDLSPVAVHGDFNASLEKLDIAI